MDTAGIAASLALALVAVAARAETVTYEGRWIGAGGDAVANAAVAATLNVYAAEADATPLATKGVTLSTDGGGYFVATADVRDLPKGAATFWLGVVPEGGSEISPRMRVSPAPFAIRAAEARVLEVDELSIEGTVEATTLSAERIDAGRAVVSGATSLDCSFQNARDIYMDKLAFPGSGSGLSLFRSQTGAPSLDFGAFPYDRQLDVAGTGLGTSIAADSGRLTFVAEDDGIAVVLVRTRVSRHINNSLSWKVFATLSSGGTTYFSNARLEDGEQHYLDEEGKAWSFEHVNAYTVPLVRGKEFSLDLRTVRTGSFAFGGPSNGSKMEVVAAAKVKTFYAGAR